MIHVSHDIETWATASNVPVLLSLGAVKFDENGILDRFHVRFDTADCQRLGMVIEAETVEWWMHVDRLEARVQLHSMGKIDAYSALDGYATWVRETPEAERGSAWSQGSNFDNAKLEAIYRLLGIDYPFTYRQQECYRTMRNRFPDVKFVRLGIHHGALDDAESQAQHLIEIAKAHGIKL